MEYKVNILDKSYTSFEFINDKETLTLSLDDIDNFKQFRFFHGDIVVYDKEYKDILAIKESNIKKQRIVGVLKISTRMIYGLNNRKNSYYIFEPIDKHFPTFLVATNDKKLIKENKYQYIVIKFNRWNLTSKLPHGNLIKVLGEVGKESVEYLKILEHYEIDQRKLKLNKKYKINQKSTIYDVFTKNELEKYIDYRDTYTVAVDPKGCLDIDDALSYEFKDNQHIIGIHIADVSSYVDKLDLYYFIKKKFFTVYCPHKKFNIFPNILADHLFSLKYNKDRLAMSVFIYLDEEFKMINYKVTNTIIKLNRTMTYEKSNNLIKSGEKNMKNIFEISKKIRSLLSEEHIELPTEYDSHNMIENYMLLANKLTAEYLIKNNKNPILRIHNEPKFQMDLGECQIKNQEVLNFLNYYQLECAVYKKYNPEIDYNYYHYGLNLKYYTHFTSPIRRIIDILIHLQVKEVVTNKSSDILTKLQIECEKVNEQQKKDKKMYREIETINIINNKLNKETYKSYVIDFKENQVSLYIPELKHLYRKNLYDKRLLSILNFEKTDNKIRVTNINTKTHIEFKKYQQIPVRILKNINKLDILFTNIDLMICL